MSIDETGLQARLLAAQAIAREAGQLAARMLADRPALEIGLKGPQDFITSADGAVETLIAARLGAAFPEDGLLAEEGAERAGSSGGLWVVDPIDGTANFASGRPDWCVSIGLLDDGRPEIGVIYQPALDLLFAARRGAGATCNRAPIAVADRPLARATIGLDYSSRVPIADHVAQIAAVVTAGADYRRNGSAAVSLTQVADGRLDGFAEDHLNAWDVVAGMVLVTEAGGWCSDFLAGDGLKNGNRFAAASPSVWHDLTRLLRPFERL
jgi:myo-inositol-1(or 4)-monophosphatase